MGQVHVHSCPIYKLGKYVCSQLLTCPINEPGMFLPLEFTGHLPIILRPLNFIHCKTWGVQLHVGVFVGTYTFVAS
jgi:hypothetical protein